MDKNERPASCLCCGAMLLSDDMQRYPDDSTLSAAQADLASGIRRDASLSAIADKIAVLTAELDEARKKAFSACVAGIPAFKQPPSGGLRIV